MLVDRTSYAFKAFDDTDDDAIMDFIFNIVVYAVFISFADGFSAVDARPKYQYFTGKLVDQVCFTVLFFGICCRIPEQFRMDFLDFSIIKEIFDGNIIIYIRRFFLDFVVRT